MCWLVELLLSLTNGQIRLESRLKSPWLPRHARINISTSTRAGEHHQRDNRKLLENANVPLDNTIAESEEIFTLIFWYQMF